MSARKRQDNQIQMWGCLAPFWKRNVTADKKTPRGSCENSLHSWKIDWRSLSIVSFVERIRLQMAFGVVDYVVFLTMLLISASIGVYVRFSGGRQKTAEVSVDDANHGFAWTLFSAAGIPLGRQEHANPPRGFQLNGNFYQLDYDSWSVKRDLSVWNAIRSDKCVVW